MNDIQGLNDDPDPAESEEEEKESKSEAEDMNEVLGEPPSQEETNHNLHSSEERGGSPTGRTTIAIATRPWTTTNSRNAVETNC